MLLHSFMAQLLLLFQFLIVFGEIGQTQVLGKLRKVLGSELNDGYDRSLEIGAGTGYFSLNLLQAGVVGESEGSFQRAGKKARLGNKLALTTLRS